MRIDIEGCGHRYSAETADYASDMPVIWISQKNAHVDETVIRFIRCDSEEIIVGIRGYRSNKPVRILGTIHPLVGLVESNGIMFVADLRGSLSAFHASLVGEVTYMKNPDTNVFAAFAANRFIVVKKDGDTVGPSHSLVAEIDDVDVFDDVVRVSMVMNSPVATLELTQSQLVMLRYQAVE